MKSGLKIKMQENIKNYIQSLPEQKRGDVETLHRSMLELMPGCRLWFLDGRDENGKVISNPNIGYGQQTMKYAGGKTREFYQIGLSANTTGISVYIMGIDDRKYLPATYGKKIGKASVTGYCIKFKALRDVDIATLQAAIRDGIKKTSPAR